MEIELKSGLFLTDIPQILDNSIITAYWATD